MHTQIFHSPGKPSKPFWNDPDALLTVQQSFDGSRFFLLDADILKFAAEKAKKRGLWVELGVATGRTIRFVAKHFPNQVIHGFDSFEGLPEEWVRKDRNFQKGSYAQESVPQVPSNVHLVKGLFNKTLPVFAAREKSTIALLHIDCDLYSSTKFAFEALRDKIVPGTVILFDEFYNYPGCEAHESKAFLEFLETKPHLTFNILAFNAMHEQVAVEIVER